MNIPTKLLKSGFSMPAYGFGTWRMGGELEKDTANDANDIAAICAAIESGVRHIDTAEIYGAGHSEELVAAALAESNIPRREMFIATKVSPNHLNYDDVLKSCEASLKRLGLDYIDLYIVHSPPPVGIKIADTMQAMNEVVRRGWAKNIGVSNFTPQRYELAQAVSENKLVCNQVNYSLMVREAEKNNLPQHAIDHDYFLTAWRPLELSYSPDVNSYPPIVEKMAEKYGKTNNQIAINWLVSQPNVMTISKTSHQKHLTENLGALGWEMSEQDIETLRRNYPTEYFCPARYQLDKIESSMPT